MKRKLLNIREFYFVPCPTYSTDSATPHSPLPAVPLLPRSGRRQKVVRYNFEIQRISFIVLILFMQRGIFLFKLFCARNRVFANFFNKIFLFDR